MKTDLLRAILRQANAEADYLHQHAAALARAIDEIDDALDEIEGVEPSSLAGKSVGGEASTTRSYSGTGSADYRRAVAEQSGEPFGGHIGSVRSESGY